MALWALRDADRMSVALIFIKAILIGAILAFPVGPVLLFVIQKTLNESRQAGIMAGLGSMCVDTLYTGMAMCALGLVSGFIDKYNSWIFIIGGLIVILVGLNITRKARGTTMVSSDVQSHGSAGLGTTLQAMGCAISNPGALFYALALVTFMNMDVTSVGISIWLVLPFVATGEMLYWMALTYALSHYVCLSDRTLRRTNWCSGIALAAIGLALIIKGIISLL